MSELPKFFRFQQRRQNIFGPLFLSLPRGCLSLFSLSHAAVQGMALALARHGGRAGRARARALASSCGRDLRRPTAEDAYLPFPLRGTQNRSAVWVFRWTPFLTTQTTVEEAFCVCISLLESLTSFAHMSGRDGR